MWRGCLLFDLLLPHGFRLLYLLGYMRYIRQYPVAQGQFPAFLPQGGSLPVNLSAASRFAFLIRCSPPFLIEWFSLYDACFNLALQFAGTVGQFLRRGDMI